MSPALTGVAIAVLVGAVLALAARDGRAAVIGLGAVLVLAPLVAEPFGSPIGLAARLTAALLATYLLWIAVRGGGVTGGSRLGWPAEALLAAAAFVIGGGTHGLGAAPGGPAEAQALGFALGTLAVIAAFTGRDVIRVGIGLLTLVQAALLLRAGLSGTPGDFEHLLSAALVAALGAAVAALAWAAAADGGGFELASVPGARVRRPRDARPGAPVGGGHAPRDDGPARDRDR